MRTWIYHLACFALLPAALLAADSGLLGRWNIDVKTPRGRVWWLEITKLPNGSYGGKFVGAPGGQVAPIENLKLTGNEAEFAFGKNQYRVKLEGTRLTGSMTTEGQPALPFTATRAPEIKDQDGPQWKPGKPVELINGRDTSGWRLMVANRPGWKVEDGLFKNEQGASDIISSAKFWNFELRAEYRYAAGSNSGIALRGRYELQIYDDYGKPPDFHGHGALYSRIAPSSNASRAPGEWQTMEARLVGRTLTVTLNGKKILDRVNVEGPTAMTMDPDEAAPGPIVLQGDHGPIEFRKLTVTPLIR